MNKEREKLIQELPEKLYEAYEMADSFAASTERTAEMQDKLRERLIEINSIALNILEG